MKNKLPEFFALFDLKPGDEFELQKSNYNPYTVTDDYEILDRNGYECDIHLLDKALYGAEKLTKLTETTENEHKLLCALYDLGFRWIARDGDGSIQSCILKPKKEDSLWMPGEGRSFTISYLPNFDPETDFQFIKWEDKEPFSIEDYVKERN